MQHQHLTVLSISLLDLGFWQLDYQTRDDEEGLG